MGFVFPLGTPVFPSALLSPSLSPLLLLTYGVWESRRRGPPSRSGEDRQVYPFGLCAIVTVVN